MRVNFEYDMHLQYENRALKARIRELESGAAYVRMQEECEKRCREMEREVRKLKTELENAVRQLRQMQITLKRNASSATAERLFHF